MIPTVEENPKGFRQKYNISKVDGSALDPRFESFILRLDEHSSNTSHVNACRKAVLAYADAIAPIKPEMARDLYNRYNQTVGPNKVAINPEPHF